MTLTLTSIPDFQKSIDLLALEEHLKAVEEQFSSGKVETLSEPELRLIMRPITQTVLAIQHSQTRDSQQLNQRIPGTFLSAFSPTVDALIKELPTRFPDLDPKLPPIERIMRALSLLAQQVSTRLLYVIQETVKKAGNNWSSEIHDSSCKILGQALNVFDRAMSFASGIAVKVVKVGS